MTLLLLLQWQSRKTLIYCLLIPLILWWLWWLSLLSTDSIHSRVESWQWETLEQGSWPARSASEAGNQNTTDTTDRVTESDAKTWYVSHLTRWLKKSLIFNSYFWFVSGEGCAWLNINFVHVSTVCWTLDFRLSGGPDDNQGLAANETPPEPELH